MKKSGEISAPWKALKNDHGEYAIFNELTGEVKILLHFENGLPTTRNNLYDIIKQEIEKLRDMGDPLYNEFIPRDRKK